MLKPLNVLRVILLSFVIVSCQKDIDNTAAAADITGTWNFISIDAKTSNTQQTADETDVFKTITVNDYVTEKNSGTIIFDGAKMTANNLLYSINTLAKSSIYENGTLTDTVSEQINFTVPSLSGAAPYKKISADSLYFESGSFFTSGSTSQSTQKPGGVKLKLENDKLYLIQSAMQSATETNDGAITTSDFKGTIIINLQRQ
jgi:hypothetical protein